MKTAHQSPTPGSPMAHEGGLSPLKQKALPSEIARGSGPFAATHLAQKESWIAKNEQKMTMTSRDRLSPVVTLGSFPNNA